MSTLADVTDVDSWITTLSDCKQLPESEIERLCEKVSLRALT
jgi:serine/threonine-protein phosphatase 2A catalytic subunit